MFQSSVFNSMDEVQQAIFDLVLTSGKRSAPRGMRTLESLAVSFTLSDPRNRCIFNPERKWSLPLALGELAWHLSGSDKAASLAYYAPIWSSFADTDGRIHGSCYGAKIFSGENEETPWKLVKQLLSIDPDTRRAILYFSDAAVNLMSKDVACAISLQFLLRKGKLDAVVNMRSNDAVWGLPYDVFLFSFLQEIMAKELNVGIGHYHHIAASMHIYEQHLSQCKKVLDYQMLSCDLAMPRIDNLENVPDFLEVEESIRYAQSIDPPRNLTPFWTDLSRVLSLYREFRHGKVLSFRDWELPEVYTNALIPFLVRKGGRPDEVV